MSRECKKGVEALHTELNRYHAAISELEHTEPALRADQKVSATTRSADDKIYALAEFLVNQFDSAYYDVKVKNIYYVSGDKYLRMGDFKAFTVYKCFKLRNPREYAAIAYDGRTMRVDEAVSSKVVRSARAGRYGTFNSLYIPEEYTDFEWL